MRNNFAKRRILAVFILALACFLTPLEKAISGDYAEVDGGIPPKVDPCPTNGRRVPQAGIPPSSYTVYPADRKEFSNGIKEHSSLSGLTNFSTGFSEEIKLDLSGSYNKNRETFVELKTSKPIRCIWFYADNPPSLIIDFIEHGIYCSFEKEIIQGNGPIKKIKPFYSNDKKEIDFLVLELAQPSSIASVLGAGFLTIKIDEVIPKAPEILSQRQAEIEIALLSAKQKIHQGENAAEATGDFLESGDVENVAALVFENPLENLSAEKISVTENEDDAGKLLALDNSLNIVPAETDDYQKTQDTVVSLENTVREKISFPDEAGLKDDVSCGNILGTGHKQGFLNRAASADSGGRHSFLIIMIYLLGFVFTAVAMAFNHKFGWNNRANLIVPRGQKKWSREEIFVEKIQPRISDKLLETGTSANDEIARQYANRRRHARIKIGTLKPPPKFKIEAVNTRQKTYKCRLKDLSLEGAGFELPAEVEVPLILQIDITLPCKTRMEICAKIIWHNFAGTGKKCYGAQFLTVTQDDRQRLKAYLYENPKVKISE